MKVQNEMSTRISVNTVSAVNSMKAFRDAIRATGDSWRAQEQALRNSGQYSEAAKARFSGLNQVIDLQKAKISELQARQDGLNMSNKKQASQFLKLERQIQQANRQLSSYEAQSRRAAQAVDVERSGVIRLNTTMQAQSALASATAERLRSQGRSYEAMGVEVRDLRSRLSTLQTIQQREASLLESTKNRLGENSQAYLKQATRVQEVGTKISQTRSRLDELNETMRRTPTGWMGNVSERLNRIQGSADKVSTSFSKIFGATAAANMFTNALGNIAGQMGTLIKSGIDYNIEQNRMVATWTTLTGSANKAQPMVNTINRMSQATGQAVSTVNELEQGFYHLNSSKTQADGMTKALLNMSDAVGLNDQQIKAVEQDMVHAMATGKVTQGELNQIGQYFPMIDEAMAKHFHTTVAGMRQMAKAGKVSAQDLQNVFEQLGNGKYQKAADNMMNSYFGVFRTIKARTPQLVGDLTAPFMTMSNPILQATRKWINDKSTDKEFKRLGTQMAKSINQVMNAFGSSNVSYTKVMDNAIRGLTQGVRELGDIVAKHHSEISNFFEAFKEGSAAQVKIFANVMLDLSKVLLPVLNTMARFPKTSAALITSFMLASKAVKALQAGITGLNIIKNATQNVADFAKKLRQTPNKKDIKVNADTTKANRQITTTRDNVKALPEHKNTEIAVQNQTANTRLAATKHSLAQVPPRKTVSVNANTTDAQRKVTTVKTEINGVPKRVQITARANTANATRSIKEVGVASKTAATTSKISFASIKAAGVSSISAIGMAVRANPLGALITGIQLASVAFSALYNHSKTFRRFVNGLASTAKSGMKKVGNFFTSGFRSIGRAMQNNTKAQQRAQRQQVRQQEQANRQMQRSWNSFSRTTSRTVSNMWRGIGRTASNGWRGLTRTASNGGRTVSRTWNNMSRTVGRTSQTMWRGLSRGATNGWRTVERAAQNGSNRVHNWYERLRNNTSRTVQAMAREHPRTFRAMYKTIEDRSKMWHDLTSGHWNRLSDDTQDIAKDMSNESRSIFGDMYDKLNSITGGRLGDILNAWKKHFSHVIGTITSSQNPVHSAFMGVLRGIATPFSNIIKGIAKGINWIADKIGGSHISADFSLNGFAKGTPNGGILHNQIALLNDGDGPHYQEMVHKAATGKTFMLPAKRNIIMPLEKGDEVLDGENSHRLANAMHIAIPHASGAIGNFFSGVFNAAKDAAEDAMDWVDKALKNVVEFGTELFHHFVEAVPGSKDNGHEFSQDLHNSLPGYFARIGQAWLKKQLEQMNVDNPPGTGVARWRPVILRAFAALHVDPAEWKVNKLLRQIQTESGGDPHAWQQIHDRNSGGNEARGLLQFAGSTWQADALPGHTDWHSGYNEILAAIHVLEQGGEGGWGNVGNGHGWAYGGMITQHGLYEVAEQDNPEMIIPLDPMKRGRAYELLSQVVAQFKGEDGNTPVNTDSVASKKIDTISRKFDAVLAQNQQLISLLDKLIGVTDSANNPTARYKRTQRDINMAQIQSFI